MKEETIHLPFDVTLLPRKTLKTGALSCFYEQGKLRYIKHGNSEAIRTIYFAVRDEAWETATYTIENESIEEKENGFSISYTSIHRLDDIVYKADVSIKAKANTIVFLVNGEALSSFKKNRIGICVLHPVEESGGQEALITQPDGTTYTAKFPKLVNPHQLFKNIRQIKYSTAESIVTEIKFEGDVFETEDQRNWADATFKTYSTPLDLPFPVNVEKGETIQQKVELIISADKPQSPTSFETYERKIRFPQLGYGRRTGEALSDEEIALLQQIPFDHYRVEVFLFENDWQKELQEAAFEAGKLNTKLELILFFKSPYSPQLTAFVTSLEGIHPLIKSILVLDADQPATPVNLLRLVYERIKTIYPQIQVGYGTNNFFADLNRNRPTSVDFDFVSFSINPQVHASDTRSVIENLERLQDLLRTTRSFAGNKDIHISPITFKIRNSNKENRNDYDSRQHTSFGAFWSLSAIKHLSAATHLSFYEAKGYRGIIKEEAPPLYKMLRKIKAFSPKWIIDKSNSSKEFPDPVILENEKGERLKFTIDRETSP